ncbi:MAG: excinuclease ABC subunit UvrA, partial [Deltaproteobacteria bacterium]|nr:excinuclease ABC subunit UvrA [Deltaproteobacteria bacterium]
GRKGEHQKLFDSLRKEGFTRVRLEGAIRELGEEIVLNKKKKHDIEVVIDRLIIKEDLGRRLTDSVELALKTSEGTLIAVVHDQNSEPVEELFFSERFSCQKCGLSIPELTPQLFSFNSPQGACQHCDGLGSDRFYDPDLIIPDRSLSICQNAVKPGEFAFPAMGLETLKEIFEELGYDLKAPLNALPEQALKIVLYGTKEANVAVYPKNSRRETYKQPLHFEGVIPHLTRAYPFENLSKYSKDTLEPFVRLQNCPYCGGGRLRPEALAVKVSGQGIKDLCDMTIAKCLDFFIHIELTPRELTIGRRIIKEIRERLGFLNDVGLGYLSLGRGSATLSGGETQRIRLATQIGSKLVGVMYVLDEPSIGLHQRDNEKLLNSLKSMRDLGNTVIIVEHDAETILAADLVLDLGPGAGENGGRLVFVGTPKELLKDKTSLTGQYLTGLKKVGVPKKRRPGKDSITIHGATGNNLKNLTVSFPLGVFTCVTGVSGSGKSTLVLETLHNAASNILHRSRLRTAEHKKISGLEHIDKVIDIDQSPIGRTPRSNPATYTGIFASIRDLFSQLPEARARGYRSGRFSFNVESGRCPKCEGDGIIRIAMHFLPDVYVRCDACQGQRYNRDTLEIKYSGHSISDVLNMTVTEASELFKYVPSIRNTLLLLQEVGLGYIRLGQSSTTLSGGEAQRIKLTKELSRRDTGRTLYILDEPTTGLHFDDINRLLDVLQKLVDRGNTVVVIEHNLDVIKNADHVIDLGPEGGEGGGLILAQGPPEKVSAIPESFTGHFLKTVLK